MRVCRSISWMWLVVLASQLACSDSSDGGGGVDTGLPATQKLSTLDDSGTMQVCTGLARGFNNILPASERHTIECAVLAIPLSVDDAGKGDVAQCKQLVDRCLNGETISDEKGIDLDELAPEMDCEGTKTSATLKACDATIADLESCGDAILDELSSKLRLIDCNNLADIEAVQKKLDSGVNSADLPGCKTLSTKCPDVDLGD